MSSPVATDATPRRTAPDLRPGPRFGYGEVYATVGDSVSTIVLGVTVSGRCCHIAPAANQLRPDDPMAVAAARIMVAA